MRSERLTIMVEMALCVALAAVLGLLKITLPWNFAGGSISLTMVPIFIVALRRGVVAGVVAGTLFGAVDYLIEPYFVHPIQVLLDYPVAFGACGLAGIMSITVRRTHHAARVAATAVMGAIIGGVGRFAASFISGIVFFGANAGPGQPVWLYSLIYNGSYLLPSVLVSAAVAATMLPVLARAVPVSGQLKATALCMR